MTTKLGELLKSEREKRGLSLHEIGMSLKINPKILTAIEEGDQANFPAKTFLRGFVKSYAQYLRLDVNQVMQMFYDEYGGIKIEEVPLTPGNPQAPAQTQPQPQAPTGPPKYETSLKRPDDSALPVSSNNRIYTILVAILLLTLIAFVAKMMDKYQKESTVERDESNVTETTTTTSTVPVAGEGLVTPVDGGATTTTLAGSVTTTTLAGAGSVTTTTLKTPAAAAASTTTTTTTTLKPVVTTTTLRPVVTTTSTTLRPVAVTTTTVPRPTVTTTTLVRTAAPTAATASTTTTTLSGVAGSSVTTTTLKPASTEIIIEALNRVTIRFSLNAGQKWESLELNPDQVHTFRSRSGILIEVSDGGAVNVIVNGRDRGVPGTIGRPLKLNFP